MLMKRNRASLPKCTSNLVDGRYVIINPLWGCGGCCNNSAVHAGGEWCYTDYM